MKKIKLFFSIVVALVFSAVYIAFAGNPTNAKNAASLAKTATVNFYSPMDINNVFNYYSNSGDGSFNPYSTSNEGFEFPIGQQSATCIFEDGLVWTAFKKDTLYCGGSTYKSRLASWENHYGGDGKNCARSRRSDQSRE